MPVNTMIAFAKQVNPQYNFYKRSGFREGMPVPNDAAAERIVADLIKDGFFVDFVELLVRVDQEGYMGRKYTLWGVNNVVAGLLSEGYSFDKVSGQFFENQRERISANWGRLLEGDERKMAVLRLDIAGSSALVKNNSRSNIEKAYEQVRQIINKVVISRIGRIWSWEGDGALLVFLFGPIEKMAIYAGIEILNELFFYNRLRNPLNSPVNIRLGTQVGMVRYSVNELERLKNEPVKQAMALEALAPVNALCVPFNIYATMDSSELALFGNEKTSRQGKYRFYSIGLEE